MQYDVLIVGAGASGLMAARELGKAGKKVLVLEARDRIGGRIYSLPVSEWGYPAQAGGEFVHGDAPTTSGLIHEAKLTLNHSIEWWSVRDGEPVLQESLAPADPRLMEKLMTLKEDLSVVKFFDTYFPDKEFDNMREFAYHWVEGYDAADVNRASVFSLRNDMSFTTEWQQRSLKETYLPLLTYLHQQCLDSGVDMQLNTEVIRIDCTDRVIVTCTDGAAYQSTKAILTIPLPLYEHIAFTPTLPEYQKAAKDIGFGSVIKILLRFKSKWWASEEREKDFERMFFMFSNEIIPTWWTQYPEQRNILTGWIAGPKTLALKDKNEIELIELALQSLTNIFNISREELANELVAAKATNWANDPYALGAYSYTTPESVTSLKILNTPVDNKIYFAGEALNEDDLVGTVEAAFSSGQSVAQKILRS